VINSPHRLRRALGALAAACALLSSIGAEAQLLDSVEVRPRFGIYGDFVRSVHASDFLRLAGDASIPYASRFDGGEGQGLAFGALIDYPLSEMLWLTLRGSIHSDNAELRAIERTVVIVGDTATFTGEFEREIDASMTVAGIEPMVGVRLPAGVTFHVGGRAGFVLSQEFTQRDVLTLPTDRGVFENGRRIRNEASGEIPGVSSMQAAAIVGVSRDLALNPQGTWFLVPEIFGSYALTPVSDSVDWSAHGLRFGIALKYSPLPAPPVIAVVPEPEPIPEPPKPPVLAASVSAVSVETDGSERPEVTIRVEEFISTQMRPLLSYIFFDESSASIPTRYRTLGVADTSAFHLNRLHGTGTLEAYYNVLNIVGRRMQQNPRATITVTGHNAGTGAERGNGELSRGRAEAVRGYLTSVWGIDAERVKIRARDLPEVASDTANPEAAAENRRVEITSSDPAILEVVMTDDTVRTVTPPAVRFRPSITSEAGVASWQLSARQNDVTVASFSGNGPVPPAIEWKPSESRAFSTGSEAPITYLLAVRDGAGQRTETQVEQIRVQQVTLRRKREEGASDRRIDRYGLILFDYDRSELNTVNQRLASMIRSRIPAGATVGITAYTDRVGEEEHNMRLSEARARATARAIGVPEVNARGVGETQPLYDNDLPEGRFYSRTVEVVVESQVR
jgi:outer membrane protein OmpA-like peptidoglycan-associated protein